MKTLNSNTAQGLDRERGTQQWRQNIMQAMLLDSLTSPAHFWRRSAPFLCTAIDVILKPLKPDAPPADTAVLQQTIIKNDNVSASRAAATKPHTT
jgi:hypothetical protein